MESQSLSSRPAHAALLISLPLVDTRAPLRRSTVRNIPTVQLDQVKEEARDSWIAENFLFVFPISLFIVLGVCAVVMSV